MSVDLTPKVQSFASFRGKVKTPNKAEHMRNCGFGLFAMTELDYGEKPSQYFKLYSEQLLKDTGIAYHIVYIRRTGNDGYVFYDAYRKNMREI